MANHYGNNTPPSPYDPTIQGNVYPTPTQSYYDQQPYAPQYAPPPSAPAGHNTLANAPTIQAQNSVQTVYAPGTVSIPRPGGAGMALLSLILGVFSIAVSWIPVCGVVALLPAIMGIIFGGLGIKSQRRGAAMAGMLLSMLAVVIALAFFI